jgi:hypothetical protein
VEPLGIEGEDAPERRAAPVIEFFQVDIVQEWSWVDVNLVLVQAGEILQKAQSAACAGAAITALTKRLEAPSGKSRSPPIPK